MRFIRHSECSCFPRSFLREGHLFKVFVFLLQISVRVKSIENRLPSRAHASSVFGFLPSPLHLMGVCDCI